MQWTLDLAAFVGGNRCDIAFGFLSFGFYAFSLRGFQDNNASLRSFAQFHDPFSCLLGICQLESYPFPAVSFNFIPLFLQL
jgi:hypothetical protein